MDRADSSAERVELWDVEAVALSKVTEGRAVALFVDSVAMDSRRRGFGGAFCASCLCLPASKGDERVAGVELD